MEESKDSFLFNNKSFKNSSVNKITIHQRNFLSQDEKINLSNKQYSQYKKGTKIYSLKRIFQEPKQFNNGKKIWPKITHPKLPFSKKNTESEEFRKLKIKLKKPSQILHGYDTIKWLRQKYSDSVIEKSIRTLLPKKNNSLFLKKEKENEKRHRKMLEYLESFKGPTGKEKYININPKYLYTESTFQKILKLREIFLEFDSRGAQKMEFDEILKMFNQNHIKADKNDIVNLFFKDKKIKKEEDILKLYLGFYQFINFALEREQDFREFMREIKQKYRKKENDDSINKSNDESSYLPMNFNLVLDYFINKEKERHSVGIVVNAIEQLEKDIKTKSSNNFNLSEPKKSENNILSLKKKSSKHLNIIKDNHKLSDINFIDLFNEFINLFKLSGSNQNDLENFKFQHKLNYMTSSRSRNKTAQRRTSLVTDYLNLHKATLKSRQNNNRNNKSDYEKYLFLTQPKSNSQKKITKDNILITLIKNQMNKNKLNKINIENFKKYHDINLAKNATLKQIQKEVEFEKLYKNIREKIRNSNKSINTEGN